ncbi:hypothetical protein ACQ9AQ_24230 [Escherichia coli]|uniref:hypothetical protein n=1 Tax=Escherichia coli TaxID=562 RepID=UPI003D35E8F8
MSEFAVSRLVIPHVVIPPAVVEARRVRGVAAGHARKRRLAEVMASPTWYWSRRESPRLDTTKKGA